MNYHRRLRLGFTVLSALGFAVLARGGTDPDTTEVMPHKLRHSQFVLRGIALDEFARIQTNAQQLVKLSQFSGWYARQAPEYELFTLEFRRHATDLVKAAKTQNLDAATPANTELTLSCVSCQQYMRGGAAVKAALPLRRP